jgi:hypothetical protein
MLTSSEAKIVSIKVLNERKGVNFFDYSTIRPFRLFDHLDYSTI